MTTASASYSHAEGSGTTASGNGSHAEGIGSTASNSCAHAEGASTTASAYGSHAEGVYTIASGEAQHVSGRYNVENSTVGNFLIVGNGSSVSARSNSFRVDTNAVYGNGPYNSSGADYAEYFEWLDGNEGAEDRAGRFVTLDGDKIRLATAEDDFILGIVSGNASVIGDSHDDQWAHMYERDIFGRFIFEDVEPGKHSLTALSESRGIGYLAFDLKEDAESDVSLLEDGTYTVSVDQSGAGVELNLVLNEQAGTIVPTGAQKIAHNLWWLWLLLALLAIWIVVGIVFYRKKKEK
jgi:hypothetical protein